MREPCPAGPGRCLLPSLPSGEGDVAQSREIPSLGDADRSPSPRARSVACSTRPVSPGFSSRKERDRTVPKGAAKNSNKDFYCEQTCCRSATNGNKQPRVLRLDDGSIAPSVSGK